MCAPNKTKKGIKAFSFLLRTHLAITICHAVRHWAPCQEWKFFFIRHELYSIIEEFYHLNEMLIATEHIAGNNFVFQYDSALHILYAT